MSSVSARDQTVERPILRLVGKTQGVRAARQRPREGRKPLGVRGLAFAAIGLAVLTFSITLNVGMVRGTPFEMDFRGDLYGAGQAIISGRSPYHLGLLDAQAALARVGHLGGPLASPRYPAPSLVAAVPLSLLPFPVASGLFMLLSLGAVALALRLLGVRDWRCYGVALMSWPVLVGVWFGNLSPLLLLGAAAAWRWRSRLKLLGAAIASVIAAKLFLWPLAVWLIVTRRFRALGVTSAMTVITIVGAWALIGFAGMTAYPHMLADIASIGEGRGSSLVAFLRAVGASVWLARAVALTVALALLLASSRVAGQVDGDQRAFGLAVMAALTATPVVWAHYLVLLFVPIALQSHRLSPIWFLPVLAGLGPGWVVHPTIWSSLPELVIELVVTGSLCSPSLGRRVTVGLGHTRGPQRIRAATGRLQPLEGSSTN